MPVTQFRRVADPETGETLNVETTRQAKRRHQKNGGMQWRPTRAQVNAAEIWNKQEAKLKKDREREAKRKKNTERQAAKDFALKERQQERLRNGEISIEDTWGKVTHSQVRLNKFFCQPGQIATCQDTSVSDCKDSIDSRHNVSNTEVNQGRQVSISVLQHRPSPTTTQYDKALRKQRASSQSASVQPPSTQVGADKHVLQVYSGLKRKRDLSYEIDSPPKQPPASYREISDASQIYNDFTIVAPPHTSPKHCMTANKEHSSPLQSLMPPPARPNLEVLNSCINPNLPAVQTRSKPPQCVLTQSTRPHTNRLINARPGTYAPALKEAPLRGAHTAASLSHQVIQETLEGLSTQVLFEGWDDLDQENEVPVQSKPAGRLFDMSLQADWNGNDNSLPKSPPPGHRKASMNVSQGNTESFGDAAIDDEILMALASPQKSEQQSSSSPVLDRCNTKAHSPQRVDRRSQDANVGFMHVKPGDSFAVSDIDESDLLDCVQDYETRETEFLNRNSNQHVQQHRLLDRVHTTGRVLPWPRKPTSDTQPGCVFIHEESFISSCSTEVLDD